MKTNKLITFGKSIAVAILILGLIHDVATFTPLIRGPLTCLNPDNIKAMTYMSLICGTSFILSGIILVMLLNKVEKFVFLISTIVTVGLFLALSGILSVFYMFNNPFAWIALFLNLSMFIITIWLRIRLKEK